MREKLKIAIIGTGWFGNQHLDYLLTRNDVEIVALVNKGHDALVKTAEKVPQAALFNRYQDLLASHLALNALIVTVQPHRHGKLEQEAAALGLHLYIEKPLGTDLALAQENLRAMTENDIICAVGYQERYRSGILEAKKALSEENIALINGWWIDQMPSAPWWRDKAQSGGQIIEQSTHIIDLMRYFVGEAEEVYASVSHAVQFEADINVDSASIGIIKFKNGTVASLTSGCFLAYDRQGKIGLEIETPKKTVTFSQTDGFQINHVPLPQEVNNAHEISLATFIEAIQTDNPRLVRSDYADALATFKLTVALERSIQEGRVIKLTEG